MNADLVAWLRACLDEDEAHAHKDLWCLDRATPTPWRGHYGYNHPSSYLRTETGEQLAEFTATDGPQRHPSGHLVDGYEDRHNRDVFVAGRMVSAGRKRAEAVLADIDAKRAIIDAYVSVEGQIAANAIDVGIAVAGPEAAERNKLIGQMQKLDGMHEALGLAVARLAAAYADRPDYRTDWAT